MPVCAIYCGVVLPIVPCVALGRDFDSPHLHDEVPLVFRAPPDFRPPAWVALMGRAAVCAGGRRPGPAAASGRGLVRVCLLWPDVAHRHRGQALSIAQDSHRVVTSHIPEPTPNFACNSPTTLSNLEITSLELRRFQASLKLHPIELHASFLGSGRIGACWWCSGIPQARCAVV